MIIALSYYGQQVGNFIINVDRQSYQEGLALSKADPTVDDSGLTSRLSTYPLGDAQLCQYQSIPENITENEGSKNDPDGEYLAFSFYLMNGGKLSTSYSVSFIIDAATREVDSILRIMIITKFPGEAEKREVFAKPQNAKTRTGEDNLHAGEPELIYGQLGPEFNDTLGITTPFPGVDDAGVYYAVNYLVRDLPVRQPVRYTVVMWLDGWDEESFTTGMFGAAIRMSMEFRTIRGS